MSLAKFPLGTEVAILQQGPQHGLEPNAFRVCNVHYDHGWVAWLWHETTGQMRLARMEHLERVPVAQKVEG